MNQEDLGAVRGVVEDGDIFVRHELSQVVDDPGDVGDGVAETEFKGAPWVGGKSDEVGKARALDEGVVVLRHD